MPDNYNRSCFNQLLFFKRLKKQVHTIIKQCLSKQAIYTGGKQITRNKEGTAMVR